MMIRSRFLQAKCMQDFLSTSPPNQIGTIEFPINKIVRHTQMIHPMTKFTKLKIRRHREDAIALAISRFIGRPTLAAPDMEAPIGIRGLVKGTIDTLRG
jgi:hypothetical protein